MGLKARRALLGSLLLVAAALVCTAEAASHLPSVSDFTRSLQASRRGGPKVSVASAQDDEYEGYNREQPPYSSSSTNGYYGLAEEKEVCLTEVYRSMCAYEDPVYDWK